MSEKTVNVRSWHTDQQLPQEIFAVLRKPNMGINPISVVATVNEDGSPHTAPFASLRAITPSLLRMICFRFHHTYSNLVRDGRLMVSFLAPPDIAVGVRGRARLLREHMAADENYAIFEIMVESVKNDMVKTVVIESPMMAMPRYEYEEWFEKAITELESIE